MKLVYRTVRSGASGRAQHGFITHGVLAVACWGSAKHHWILILLKVRTRSCHAMYNAKI
jgi:hypothetical protein